MELIKSLGRKRDIILKKKKKKKKKQFGLPPFIEWIALWIVNTDITKCQCFCITMTMTMPVYSNTSGFFYLETAELKMGGAHTSKLPREKLQYVTSVCTNFQKYHSKTVGSVYHTKLLVSCT